MATPPKPTPGIEVRHSRQCAAYRHADAACDCTPSYRAWVWSKDDGKRIQQSFTGKGALSAAKGWRRDALAAVAKAELRAPRPTIVRQAAEAWLEKAEAGLPIARGGRPYKPAVVRTYAGDLERYVLPELGDVRLDDLRRRHVQAFINSLVEQRMPGASVRRIVMPLRVIVRHAIQLDELHANPLQYLALPAADGRRERAVFPVEAESLLAPLDYADQALWATAIYAGLRRGELRGLRWNDIAADLSTLTVRRGWDDVVGPIEPKSKAAHRTVPLFAPVRHRLLELQLRSGRNGDDLVFGRTVREPFTPTHVRARARKAWLGAALAAFLTRTPVAIELKPLGLHEGRHSAKSMMSEAGIPDGYIDLYMGHSGGTKESARLGSAVGARYWHANPREHIAANTERFDTYFARVTGEATSPQASPQTPENRAEQGFLAA